MLGGDLGLPWGGFFHREVPRDREIDAGHAIDRTPLGACTRRIEAFDVLGNIRKIARGGVTRGGRGRASSPWRSETLLGKCHGAPRRRAGST